LGERGRTNPNQTETRKTKEIGKEIQPEEGNPSQRKEIPSPGKENPNQREGNSKLFPSTLPGHRASRGGQRFLFGTSEPALSWSVLVIMGDYTGI
jgi:hypothetical protein